VSEQVIEAELVDEALEAEHPPAPTEQVTTAVVHRGQATASREALMPLAADQVVKGLTAYQELLPQLLDTSDYQDAGQGKRFVKKSGWRKIARAFNLSVEIVSISVERDGEGAPLRAECVARATAPNGQVQDGDGYCSVDEKRFERETARTKVENDLRATATTRAKNRAIADLVGMGEVSAEEATAKPDAGPAVERADDELQKRAKLALGTLVGDPDRAREAWTDAVKSFGGIAPPGLCQLILDIAPEGS
jgi:hypothetical protein